MLKILGKLSDLKGSMSQWTDFDIVHTHNGIPGLAHGHSIKDYGFADQHNKLPTEIVYKDRFNSLRAKMTDCNVSMHHKPHDNCDGYPADVSGIPFATTENGPYTIASMPVADKNGEPLLGLDYTDPIERVLIDIVQTNRRKRADYAQDGNIFSNFEQAAFAAGTSVEQGIEYMIATKQARLVALRSNGRDPENESVYDTMLDRAVYSIIALAYTQKDDKTYEQ